MTSIKMEETNKKFKLVVCGHADYNPGNDIVCAACSVLVEVLIRTLGEMEHPYSHTVKSGYAEVETHSKAAAPYFRMAYIGYRALAEAYPKNVQITE